MEEKKENPHGKKTKAADDEPNNWNLAVAILALLKQDSKKMQQQVKAISKSNRQLACTLLTTEVEGWTPAHACALRGSKKLMKAIIQTGVAVNSTMGQPEGLPAECTLLHVAANRKDKKIVNYLLQQGASVNAVDSTHLTPLDYATSLGNKEVVRLLLSWGAVASTPNPTTTAINVPTISPSSPVSPPKSCPSSNSLSSSSCSYSLGRISRGRSPNKNSRCKFKLGCHSVREFEVGKAPKQQQQQQEQQSLINNRQQPCDHQHPCVYGDSLQQVQRNPSYQEKTRLHSPSSTGHRQTQRLLGGSPSINGPSQDSDVDKSTSKPDNHRLRPSSLYMGPKMSRGHHPYRHKDVDHQRDSPLQDGPTQVSPQDAVAPQLPVHNHRHGNHSSVHHHQQKQALQQQLQPQRHQPKFHGPKLMALKRCLPLYASTPCLFERGARPASVRDSHSSVRQSGGRANDSINSDSNIIEAFRVVHSNGNPATRRRRFSSSERVLEPNTAESTVSPHKQCTTSISKSSQNGGDKNSTDGTQTAFLPTTPDTGPSSQQLMVEFTIHETTL